MKGLIAYSSLTGNTAKLADRLAAGLADLGDWTLADIKKGADAAGYDCILAGGWIDRAWPDKAAKAWIEDLPADLPLGIFVTMGALPESPHGDRVKENLASLLAGHGTALGMAVLPGVVEAKLLDRVRQMPAHVLGENGESIKQQMVEAGEQSRMPTEEEYQAGVQVFREAIQGWLDQKGDLQ